VLKQGSHTNLGGTMQIATLPVYSKLADPTTIPAEIASIQPQGWQLSQHQLETYRALIDPSIDVVINTAMTGDGKSLAGLLPLLADKHSIMGLYPTNELAQDQLRNSQQLLPKWQGDPRDVGQISGPILDELLAEGSGLSRGDTLLRELNHHSLVLSNPDLLHAISQFFYQQYGRAPSHVVSKLGMLFNQFTFDEFHIFDIAQITAVLTGLLFLHEQSARPPKTLFLSATPDQNLLRPLVRLGFKERLRLIDPQGEGWYRHGPDPGEGWRRILQATSIEFAPQQASEWLSQGLNELIVPWFERHGKGAKAAIIVNSVASALQIVDSLRASLPSHIRVAPNTGLNGRSTRKASYDADILVGTSTVDVGVDFHINLLIFESSDAGSFMQRLGRLGRHDGYQDSEGNLQRFHEYKALALVPNFIYERLTQYIDDKPPKLEPDMQLQRDELSRIINDGVFLHPSQFRLYPQLWGRFQAAKVLAVLSKKPNSNSFKDLISKLYERYRVLTLSRMKDAFDEWEGYSKSGQEALVQEAQSFRGGGTFPSALLKSDEGELLSYDLLWLLSYAQIELIERDEFEKEAKKLGLKLYSAWLDRQLFYFRWHGLLPKREFPTIVLTNRASNWGQERHHTAQVIDGFSLSVNTQTDLNTINNRLLDMKTVALLIPDLDPQEVRRCYYLTGNMPLFGYSNDPNANPRSGTIAFGRTALLLDSLLQYRKDSKPSGAIIC
jgi:CRISPR-associated endonuclease/helicase Cas3